jgi:hypothetical protein
MKYNFPVKNKSYVYKSNSVYQKKKKEKMSGLMCLM